MIRWLHSSPSARIYQFIITCLNSCSGVCIHHQVLVFINLSLSASINMIRCLHSSPSAGIHHLIIERLYSLSGACVHRLLGVCVRQFLMDCLYAGGSGACIHHQVLVFIIECLHSASSACIRSIFYDEKLVDRENGLRRLGYAKQYVYPSETC